MPRSEPVTILVVNEQADEVKLVTMSLRGFFPDCRVEVVYSAAEALQAFVYLFRTAGVYLVLATLCGTYLAVRVKRVARAS